MNKLKGKIAGSMGGYRVQDRSEYQGSPKFDVMLSSEWDKICEEAKEHIPEELLFPDGPPNLTKDAAFDDLDLDKIGDKEFNYWFRRFYKGDCCVPFKVWNEACRRANKVESDNSRPHMRGQFLKPTSDEYQYISKMDQPKTHDYIKLFDGYDDYFPLPRDYKIEIRILFWIGYVILGFICGWLAHG